MRNSYTLTMRIAVVSDIHANLVAFDAVLRHAGEIDGVWNTGDAVGYGPQPSEVINRLRELDAVWVAGNHERAATGAISTEDFNEGAAAAAHWTRDRLSDAEKSGLDALPETCETAGCVLVHGTLRDPIWEYLAGRYSAEAHLALMPVRIGFVGHTHIPLLIREDPEDDDGFEFIRMRDGDSYDLRGEHKFVLNAGSVGQPRDDDPRASYGIFDTDALTFTLHRVDYDIKTTQKLMADEDLPLWLIQRLSSGR